eukprot:gene9174-780_t
MLGAPRAAAGFAATLCAAFPRRADAQPVGWVSYVGVCTQAEQRLDRCWWEEWTGGGCRFY